MAGEDLDRIERNVRRMIELKAPETDIDAYLGTENMTAAGLRNALTERAKPDPTGGRTSRNSGAFNTFVGQGLGMGLGDEAAAAGAGAGAFLRGITRDGKGISDAWTDAGNTYDQQLAAERKSVSDYMTDHPVIGAGMQFAGGLAGSVPAKTARLATEGFNYLRNIRDAAVMGGATGFASGEGGAGERLESGAIGAGTGATLAGVVPFLARGASQIVKYGKNILGLNDPDAQASRLILRAFQDDGINLDDAAKRLAEWERQGRKPEMLFDLGGENVKSLANISATMPGPARNQGMNVLAERQAAQGERLSDDIAKTISGNSQFYDTADALSKARAQAARPLYEKALDAGPVHSDRVSDILRDPIMRDGIKRGLEVQRIEAVRDGVPFNPADYAVVSFNDAGDPVIGAVPNMRLLDAAKRGLDDILEKYRNKTTGELVLDERGRAIDGLRRAYVNLLDDLNPDYKAARAAWAGPSQTMDAMALGRQLFSKDSELTTKAISELSPGDKEFFKAGVVRALKDIADRTRDGADITKRIAGTPGMRDRLRAAFDSDEAFNSFIGQVKREADMYANAQYVSPRGNSQTARRLMDAEDIGNDPTLDVIGNLFSGNFGQAARSATTGPLRRRVGSGINSDVSEAMSGMLFQPRYENQAQTLARLLSEGNRQTSRQAELQALARALLRGGGAGSGTLN